MDIKALHDKFKDDHSPSVEGQIRWLQKQGFAQHHIEQAMAEMYSDIERGELPICYERTANGVDEALYFPKDINPPGKDYTARPIANGWDIDQALLDYSKRVRTEELGAILANIERFEKKMRKKWINQVPWYKRAFGVKPVEEPTE